MKKIITVLGAGNMGTAVAQVLALNGHEVRIWNWEGDHLPLKHIQKHGENKEYLPGVKLHKSVIPKFELDEALNNSEMVFFVVPSTAMEHTISFAARSIKNNAILVDVSKGVEPVSLRLIPHIIIKHVRPKLKKNVVTISGPAVAGQMVRKKYTAMNVASKNRRAMQKVSEIMQNDFLKLIPTTDVIGVEVLGSFKNVYAIAIGMCDGLDLGLNTKAALLTNALQEMTELVKAMGGKKRTVYDLAGVGDLIGTALCEESRNRQFGEFLIKSKSGVSAKRKIRQTVEGISATDCLLRLAKKHKIETPFAHTINKCIKSKKNNPKNIFQEFLIEK